MARARAGCSRSTLAGTGGKVGRGRACHGCGHSALAGMGGKVGGDTHTPDVTVLR